MLLFFCAHGSLYTSCISTDCSFATVTQYAMTRAMSTRAVDKRMHNTRLNVDSCLQVVEMPDLGYVVALGLQITKERYQVMG
jgi:hypothetical protein